MSETGAFASTHNLGDEAFMSVADLRAYVAEVESAKASQSFAAMEGAEKAKKELIEKLLQPVEITPDRVQAFMARIRVAAERGESEMLIMRFPSELCTDRGRAINNSEEGWPDTLIGATRQFHDIWKDKLHPLGYRLKAFIVEWPHGFPGDVGMFLAWS